MSFKNILKFILLILLISTTAFIVVKSDFSIYDMRDTIHAYGAWAPIAFLITYIVGTIIFLPATPFDLLAGALFGTFFGFLLIIIGSIIVAMLAFVLARYLGKDFVEKILKNRLKKINKYKDFIEHHGFKAVLILRLIPIFPFNGLNLMLGITKIKFKDYFWGTVVGIMPAAFVYVYFGESLASANAVDITISIILVALIFLASYFVKKTQKFKDLFKTE